MDALPYGYEPLRASDAFRLLVVEPAQSLADPLRCRLIHRKLSDEPRFEALSYVWGSPTDLQTCLVEGCAVKIRRNLHDALIYLRNPHHTRVIWADALCIDQSNVAERNHQVGQMRRIYSLATTVAVWLGRASPLSALAMKWLDEMELPRRSSLGIPGRLTAATPAHIVRRQTLRWQALARLCAREFWGRLWIVQEVVLAQRVILHCGERETSWNGLAHIFDDWDRLFKPAACLKETQFIKRSLAGRIHTLRNTHMAEGCTLGTLMAATRRSVCSDPRDRVYALLGLSDDCKSGKFTIDYSQGVKEVYYGLWKFFIQDQNSSLIMRGSQILAQSMPPDRAMDCYISDWLPPTALNIVGRRAVEVLYAGQPWKSNTAEALYKGVLQQLYTGTFQVDCQYKHFCSMLYNMSRPDQQKVGVSQFGKRWDSLLQQKSEQTPPAVSEAVDGGSTQAKLSSGDTSFPFPEDVDDLSPNTSSTEAQCPGFTFWKRFDCDNERWRYEDTSVLVLRNGQMGIGPPTTRIGDKVCQFEDTDITAVIRKTSCDFFAEVRDTDIFGKCLLAQLPVGSEPDAYYGGTSQVEDVFETIRDSPVNFYLGWDTIKWLVGAL